MEYFTNLPDFQVIVCKECQYAVLPSHIDAHFTAKPQHGLGKRERHRIATEIAEINGLIGNEETLRRCEFTFPPSTSKPIPALTKPRRDGMQCMFDITNRPCPHICYTTRRCKSNVWKSMDGRAEARETI
jgi:hypothetical protein